MQTLEQVTASVLQYIYVIARPLVLQAEDHPVSWTHTYADITVRATVILFFFITSVFLCFSMMTRLIQL